MATVDKGGTVTLQELVVSGLAHTDAVAKLLIEKGVITQDEFMEKIKGGEGDVPGDISEGDPLRYQKQSFGGSSPSPVSSSNASSYIPLKIIDLG